MIEEKSWKEFKDSGLFWWINMLLHTFGWAIVINMKDDEIVKVYPARVKFRGFSEQSNTNGYRKVSEHLKENIEQLVDEAKE